MHDVNKAYYHFRWTRIPRDSGKGLTITNTQQSSMQSQHLMNSISIPLLANVHCLVETQDIQYTSGDIEIRINFSETICFYKMSISVKQFGSTKCRLSGYRLRRMLPPWNRLGDSRLSESRLMQRNDTFNQVKVAAPTQTYREC